MPSDWGKRNSLRGYDKLRTGLSYEDVRLMLQGSQKHREKHKAPHDRRHTVLGLWHELKLQLYEQAIDRGYEDEDPS